MRLSLALVVLGLVQPLTGQSYHVAKTVTLGGTGGWDYLALDTVGHRLFIAHQDRVLVVNPDNGTALGEIPGMNGAHGIAFAYDAGHGFATSGHDSTVTMFDLTTLAVLGRTKVALDDDAVLYDATTHRVFTFNGDSRSATALDPATGGVVQTIDLGTAPEFAVAAGDGKAVRESRGRRGRGGDRREHDAGDATVVPSSMRASDRPRHRPRNTSPLQRLPESGHGDLGRDCGQASSPRSLLGRASMRVASTRDTHLAFASNADGTITAVREASPDSFVVAATVTTRRARARWSSIPLSHRIFTVTARLWSAARAHGGAPHPRPAVVPGTFALLLIDP